MKKYDYLVSDVDGILTNGGHYYTGNGKYIKKFGSNDKDALHELNNLWVKQIIFITADKTGYLISKKRIEDELGFTLKLVDCDIEREKFFNNLPGRCIYLGDGIYDSKFLRKCDLSFALLDSTPQAKESAKYILPTQSGSNVFPYLLEFMNKFQNSSNGASGKMLTNVLENISYLKKIEEEIEAFGELIANAYSGRNKVVFCGVGKNALLSEMICEFLHPFNITALALDPHRAVHGNLGIIEKEDLLILSSKSGNTSELVYLLNCLRKKQTMENVFLICSNNEAELIHSFNFKKVLITPKIREIARFSHSPQTTILMFLTIMQIIVNKLANKKNVSEQDYFLNHPAGEIGKKINHYKNKKQITI